MNSFHANTLEYGPAGCKKIILKLWLQRFDTLYPSEKACENAILSHLHATGQAKCNTCESTDATFANNGRVGKCNRCRKDVSITADTFFDNVRRFRPYWTTIWLMGQGVSFNPCDLKNFADTVYSNAWKIHKKVSIVIDSILRNQQSAIAVDSALFATAICKRSRETPANLHPWTEQEETEKRSTAADSDVENSQGKASTGPRGTTGAESTAGAGPLSDPAQAVYDLLSLTPITIDQLINLTNRPISELSAILIMLELEGLIESLPGTKYIRSSAAARNPVGPSFSKGQNPGNHEDAEVTGIVGFIRSDFHGISRKYLQVYLAAHWCHTDRDSWTPNSLLSACGNFRTLKYEDILAFVTPLKVKLVPCCA